MKCWWDAWYFNPELRCWASMCGSKQNSHWAGADGRRPSRNIPCDKGLDCVGGGGNGNGLNGGLIPR